MYQQAAYNTATIPASYFGIHVNKLGVHNNWPPLNQYEEINTFPLSNNKFRGIVRLWDTATKWSDIEPSSGTWDFSRFDYYVNYIQSNCPTCQILYTMGITPCWAASNPNAQFSEGGCTSMPSQISTWQTYATTVAQR